ncbi:transglycosylase domain-containing protein [Streptomyces boninensis]|uniref:transglycosylase domain-containing protein n=1 Tax=Streptomyces boninensis TaxID=2039455 RepID=UPI003B20F256
MAYKRPGGGLTVFQQASKFVGVSVLAGAVLAGISLPAIGALGLMSKETVEGFDELPVNMKQPPLSQKSTILDVKGNEIASVYARNRTVVELNDIAPVMQQAIVAIEDQRFYKHGAVDLKGILRALNSNAQAGTVQEGASTLTQQYVKNVFVEEAGDSKAKVAEATRQTIGRKIKELKYAIQVEEELGKKTILKNYLNIAFFGEQAYGVEAAAQRYYSKSAKELSLTESAMLAGIVQSPSRYDPVNDEEEAKKRRNLVLQRMANNKYISQDEADAAKKKGLGLKVSQPRNGCITAVKGAGFFCDYVREVFLKDKAFGKTEKVRAARWKQGGLTIKTTLDPQAQDATNKSIRQHVYQSDRVATAVSMVEPGTGKIRAMGQSRPYGFSVKKNETQINLSAEHSMGGSNFGYQVGSTFKPFTAAAALEQGTPLGKSYPAPYKMNYPSPVKACKGNWNESGVPVENENEEEVGPYALKEALAKSVNTYFVQMISDIGICPVTTLAKDMGIQMGNGGELPQTPSVTLGSATIAPLTMANAYATFANRGVYCTPIALESITDANGKRLPVPKSSCKRVMSEKTADSMNTLLKGVVEDGTGKQAGLTGRDNAGKTGTTDERTNAWFVGYTPNLAGAVWVGGAAKKVSMVNIQIGPTYHAKVFGADTPGPIWREAMSGALEGKPAPKFNTVKIPKAPDRHHDEDEDEGDDDGGWWDTGGGDDGKPRPTPTLPSPIGGADVGTTDGIIGGNNGGGNGNGGGNNGGTVDGGTVDGGTVDGGTMDGGTTGWPESG